jgi:hypothetical protein
MNDKNETPYIIYKTTNLKNGKYYIGKHKLNPKKNYLGSGIGLLLAIEKYGKESFKRETLYSFKTEDEAYKKELELVTEKEVENPNCYNRCLGGRRADDFIKANTLESRKKLEETLIHRYGSKCGRLHSKESFEKARASREKKYNGDPFGNLHTKEAFDKSRGTYIQKYGKLCALMHTDDAKRKSAKTKLRQSFKRIPELLTSYYSLSLEGEVKKEGCLYNVLLYLYNPRYAIKNRRYLKPRKNKTFKVFSKGKWKGYKIKEI